MADHENDALHDPFGDARKAFDAMTDPGALRSAGAAIGLDPGRFADAWRTVAERSMEQSKEAYGRMRTAADEASRALESTIENAHTGSLTLSKKVVDGMRASAEMGFAHVEQLAAVKSVAELIELQTSYVRRQAELAGDQAKAMQSLSQAVTQDVMRPARAAAEKATRGDDEQPS